MAKAVPAISIALLYFTLFNPKLWKALLKPCSKCQNKEKQAGNQNQTKQASSGQKPNQEKQSNPENRNDRNRNDQNRNRGPRPPRTSATGTEPTTKPTE